MRIAPPHPYSAGIWWALLGVNLVGCWAQCPVHLRRAGLLEVSPFGPSARKKLTQPGWGPHRGCTALRGRNRSTSLPLASGSPVPQIAQALWVVGTAPEKPPCVPLLVTPFCGPQISLAWSSFILWLISLQPELKPFLPHLPSLGEISSSTSPVGSTSCWSALPWPLSKLLSVLSWIKDVNAQGKCSPYLLLQGPSSPVSTGRQQEWSTFNLYLFI